METIWRPIAVPPGETIKEQLEDRRMSQKELAKRVDMSEKHISKLINGEVQLTPDVALRLEMVLGVPAGFWNNLEAIYREKLSREQQQRETEEEAEIAKKYPYGEMAKYGWVPEINKTEEKVINLRKFFEVAKLKSVTFELFTGLACRRQAETEKADYSLLAWAQQARIEARSINTKKISIKNLNNSIAAIRSMTVENPEIFSPRLKTILANCGVALVFLPHMDGSFLHGASFLDADKIVIGLTVRGKTSDRFWFSLFHEIAHIILGHIYSANGTTEKDEWNADEFSKNTLISEEEYRQFIMKGDYSLQSLYEFSNKIGIDVGILVGRLQKEKYISYRDYNNLKKKYKIA